MPPCLAYPKLKKYKHLVGNYGGAWQSSQAKEFDEFPGAVLMTTNCISVNPFLEIAAHASFFLFCPPLIHLFLFSGFFLTTSSCSPLLCVPLLAFYRSGFLHFLSLPLSRSCFARFERKKVDWACLSP